MDRKAKTKLNLAVLLAITLFLFVFLATSILAIDDKIVSGNFEIGNLTGWNTSRWSITSYPLHVIEGSYSVKIRANLNIYGSLVQHVNITNNTTLHFWWARYDDTFVDSYRFYLDNKEVANKYSGGGWTEEVFNLSVGEHELRWFAQGGSATRFFDALLDNITIKDIVPPTITIESPLNQTYPIGPSCMWFNLTTNEAGTCKYSLDSTENVSMSNDSLTHFYALTSQIAVGSHNVIFYCDDTLGNENSTSIVFEITADTTPPVISIDRPENKTYASTSFGINITTDGSQACWYNLNSAASNVSLINSSMTNWFSSSNITAQERNNTLIVYCNDAVGNENSLTRLFWIDTIVPIVTLVSPSDGYSTTSTTIVFSYNVTDASNIANCSLILDGVVDQSNSSITKNVTQSFSKTLSVGSYTWSINCTDIAGWQGNSSSFTLTINSSIDSSNGESGSSGSSGSSGYYIYMPTKKIPENETETQKEEPKEEAYPLVYSSVYQTTETLAKGESKILNGILIFFIFVIIILIISIIYQSRPI